MLLSTAAYGPGQFGTMTSETITSDKMTGLFASLFLNRASDQTTPEALPNTGAGLEDRQKELMELGTEWRRQEVSLLIDQILKTSIFKHGKSIAEQISRLREMFQEEEGPGADISSDSLRAFLTFVHRIPYTRQPEISLTPGGEIYIRWKKDTSTLFSIHFLTDKIVRFVIFQANDHHPRIINRFSGIDAVDTVLETVKNSARKVFAWIIL
jgi:hypothetical protein